MSKQPLIDQLDQAITRILADPDVLPSSIDPSLEELLRVARDLRDIPSPDFKARLRADLERNASMTKQAVVFRPGFRTVTPYIVVPGGEQLIEFMKHTFGAEETGRANAGSGAFHAEVRIGDSMLMIGQAPPELKRPPSLGAFQVYVQNADEVYRRALEAGAVSLADMVEDHGDRFGCVRDASGNRWYISTHLGGHYIPEHLHTVTPFLHAVGAHKLIDFLKQAFGAEELARYDSPEGEVLHAKIRIGDSVVETSEAHGWWQPLPAMIHLYVPDVDAWYSRAMQAAGAKSLSMPADQRYGDRSGGIEDPFGNKWYMATPISV
jgi:uncharacterized glyoxalase superfamily protein PhnB